MSDYELCTGRVVLREYAQKGFEGSCRYQIKTGDGYAAQIATLASFACYAGIGSKTTMGMGQVRVIDGSAIKGIGREALGCEGVELSLSARPPRLMEGIKNEKQAQIVWYTSS